LLFGVRENRSPPMLLVRLIRALLVFGQIFASYMVQLGLGRLFGRIDEDGDRILPPWLKERRRAVDRKNAKRLLAGMLRLRGVFIKLGQVLSLMGGFLPRVYAKELEQLQDQVPPQPFKKLIPTFQRSFGKSPAELYRDIEETPIAAASLGQVHVAHLTTGEKVAVKVLYPGIRGIIAVDLRVMRLAIRVYKWFVPVARIERVHESLVDLLRRETDYEHEASCMERMAENFASEDDIVFPEVVHALTTKDVLTMTFMEGIKITRLGELEAQGIRTDGVALRLIQAFYKMLFADRFFHADPHPGNFLVAPYPKDQQTSSTGQKKAPGFGGRLVVLDFGAVCVARPELIDGMIEILRGFFTQDDSLVLVGFRRMGFVAPGGNDELLEKTVKSYFSKLLKVQDRSASALLRAKPDQLRELADPEVERGELQSLMRSFEYPEDWFYVERACVLMFWLAGQIDPTLDTIMAGFPYVMPLLSQTPPADPPAPTASPDV
jgi:ubiquinone biosynthesis protein